MKDLFSIDAHKYPYYDEINRLMHYVWPAEHTIALLKSDFVKDRCIFGGIFFHFRRLVGGKDILELSFSYHKARYGNRGRQGIKNEKHTSIKIIDGYININELRRKYEWLKAFYDKDNKEYLTHATIRQAKVEAINKIRERCKIPDGPLSAGLSSMADYADVESKEFNTFMLRFIGLKEPEVNYLSKCYNDMKSGRVALSED